jgi:two-component system, OmpR family, sensor histidine kinase KdpD
MSDQRPDPDKLLEKVQREEAKARAGRLKVFFGACAGVGKTYAMLSEAHEVKAQGLDVVVGVVETHQRAETQALLDGLEIVPPLMVPYRGVTLRELDIDGALARKPQLILVDELAHTNAPGSRHQKRWQDVKELLAAGIDVYTTVNVQHVESLNDVVGQITGVRVWETVPDKVFDEADEIELVDLPPDDLLQRLKEGKVYMPEQAAQAVKSFFRKGNLIALREMALRRTADRVDAQAREYREDEAISRVWQLKERLLVAVGPGAHAEQVVRAGRRLADSLRADWIAVYVETPRLQRLPEAERARILRALRLAQELGARTATMPGQDIAQALAEYASERNAGKIVLGRSRGSGWVRALRQTLFDRLAARSSGVDLLVVSGEPQAEAVQAQSAQRRPGQPWRGYIEALAAIALATLIALPLRQHIEIANIAMLYLLSVVLVSVRAGRGPAVAASVLAVGSFDFFCVKPYLTFGVSDTEYLLTFAVMLVVALTITHLTAGMRYQARVAAARERRAAALYAMSRELSGALAVEQIVDIARQHLQGVFEAPGAVLIADLEGHVVWPPGEHAGALREVDLSIAQWVYDHEQPAGFGTDTLAGTPVYYLPLRAPVRTRGVLALAPRNERLIFTPEQHRLLETFAAQIALALERVHFVEIARVTEVHMASERLRNSLLASISHDLRTPLTALIGSADTLLLTQPPLPEEQAELARGIRQQARRMATLVDNLLDMARLQAGGVTLNRQWHSVEEVVGSALQQESALLARHRIDVQLPADLPLVRIDAVLMERVLCNLLENAAKYTPPGTLVEIGARADEGVLQLWVADDGPGLQPGSEERIFGKFVRGDKESATPGVGLGLSICRAIVEAHNGSIKAESGSRGGARFVLTLPVEAAPALDPEPDLQPESQAP